MKVFVKTLLLAVLLASALPVYARGCGLHEQMESISQRIDSAVDANSLTARDVLRLQEERDAIRRTFHELRESQGEDISPEDCDAMAERINHLERHVEHMIHHNSYDRDDHESYRQHY